MSDSEKWMTSAASADETARVEVRRRGKFIEVRDSRDGDDGPVLQFTPGEWRAWLDGARKGEFDHLAPMNQPTAAGAGQPTP